MVHSSHAVVAAMNDKPPLVVCMFTKALADLYSSVADDKLNAVFVLGLDCIQLLEGEAACGTGSQVHRFGGGHSPQDTHSDTFAELCMCEASCCSSNLVAPSHALALYLQSR